MELTEWSAVLGNFGEFVGALAVVATLAYLAVQVRQSKQSMDRNSQIILAQNYQTRAVAGEDGMRDLAESNHLAPLLARVGSGRISDPAVLAELTPEEHVRLVAYHQWLVLGIDNQLYQYEKGFADGQHFESAIKPALQRYTPIWEELGILSARRASFLEALEPYRRRNQTP